MKRFLAVSLILSAAAAANAQLPAIGLFFTNSADPAGVAPAASAFNRDHWSRNPAATHSTLAGTPSGPGAPSVSPSDGEYLYLWATIADGQDIKVLGMNINVVVDGGNGTIDAWQLYGVRRDETDTFSGATAARFRWEPTAVSLGQGTLSPDSKSVSGSTLTAVQANGIQNNGNGPVATVDALYVWDETAGVTTALLGAYRFTGTSGNIWIELGLNGFGVGAGLQPPVFLGASTSPVPGGVGANGRRGTSPSATIIPEPASLLLLGLAGLALRRR